MKYFIKFSFIHFFLLVILTSCGTDHSKKGRSLASIGQKFPNEVRSMRSDQTEIGLKICQALRSKRTSWYTTPVIGKTAKFNVIRNTCEREEEDMTFETKITSVLMAEPIVFDSFYTDFFSKVMTDVHGPLKTICPLVLSGDDPIEFYAEGNDRVYVNFYNDSNDISSVTLYYAEADSDDQQELNGYKTYKVVSYEIVTSSPEPEVLGSVKKVDQVQACEKKSTQSTMTQTLISIL